MWALVRVRVGVCYYDSRRGGKQDAMTKAWHCCRAGGWLQKTYKLGRGDNASQAGGQQQCNEGGGRQSTRADRYHRAAALNVLALTLALALALTLTLAPALTH